MQNLSAFTAAGCDYPAYVSINRKDGGDVEITVRSPRKADGRCGDCASISLAADDFARLVDDLRSTAPPSL